MDEQTKASFASAAETSKQLITLSTALLALEITFAKDIMKAEFDKTAKCLLCASWVFLLLSVIAGVWTLLSLTGSLSQLKHITPKAIYGSNVRIPSFVQIVMFLGGLGFTVWFGLRGIYYVQGNLP